MNALSFRDLLRISRPLLWLNTAVLWVLALLVLGQPPTGTDLLMIGYFTFPFNLWLHGINDVYDHESDLLNARKGGDEGARVPPAQHGALLRHLLLWNLPFWLFALWQGSALAVMLLTLFLFLGWAYSAPPIRAKSRPFLDSLINSAYALPFLIALAWHGASYQTWQVALPALLAFALWSIASHIFTSIQDIEPDRAAGIRTIATFLGARRSARLALLLYLLVLPLVARYGWQWVALVAVYPLLLLSRDIKDGAPEAALSPGFQPPPLPTSGEGERHLFFPSPRMGGGVTERSEVGVGAAPQSFMTRTIRRLPTSRLNPYRLFIAYNSLLGFVVTVALALATPANTLWAALLLLGLVAMVGIVMPK